MNKYIDNKLLEFRKKFKHSQFVNHAAMEQFIKEALEFQQEEMIDKTLLIIDRWYHLHPSIIKAEVLKLKSEQDLSSEDSQLSTKLSSKEECPTCHSKHKGFDSKKFLAAAKALHEEACKIPPKGWYCTRKAGHEDPCAAWPEEEQP